MAEIKHYHYSEVEAKDACMDGLKDVKMRIVIGEESGAPNFYMRVFEVAPGGHTPYHSHDFEHENYIMEGGELLFSRTVPRMNFDLVILFTSHPM